MLPGDDAQAAYAHAVEYVLDYLKENVSEGDTGIEFDKPYLAKPGLSDEHNSELATSLSRAIKECGHKGTWIGVPFGTDAHAFSSRDIPTVVFGPGSIDQAHTVDEWIELEQLHQATEILGQFIAQSC